MAQDKTIGFNSSLIYNDIDPQETRNELLRFSRKPKTSLTHVERKYLDAYCLDKKADPKRYWPKLKNAYVKAHLLRECEVGRQYLQVKYQELDKMAIEQFHASAGMYLRRLEEQSTGLKPTKTVVGEVVTKDGIQALETKTYDMLAATSKLIDLLKEIVMDTASPSESQIDVNVTYV